MCIVTWINLTIFLFGVFCIIAGICLSCSDRHHRDPSYVHPLAPIGIAICVFVFIFGFVGAGMIGIHTSGLSSDLVIKKVFVDEDTAIILATEPDGYNRQFKLEKAKELRIIKGKFKIEYHYDLNHYSEECNRRYILVDTNVENANKISNIPIEISPERTW